MRYRLGVEDIEAGHWVAWVLDLPGCYSPGSTRTEAIANAGASMAAYEHWLAAHEGRPPVDDPYMDIHVVESFQCAQGEPQTVVSAFFEDDRRSLTRDEVVHVLAVLDFTRRDLLAVIRRIPPGKLAEPFPREPGGSIDGIVRHLAGAEHLYLDRLGMALPDQELPADTAARLEKVRNHLRATLPRLAGHGEIVTLQGECWSARKLARRALWHERDHTQHITRLIG